MPIAPAHFRQLLQTKEQDLLAGIARAQSDAQDAVDRDSPEPVDRATSLDDEDRLLQHSDAEYHQLQEVRDALARLDAGTYGICEDTGEPIEEKRLEALPWARYSLAAQEIRDSEAGATGSSPTL